MKRLRDDSSLGDDGLAGGDQQDMKPSLEYLKAVKDVLHDQREKYSEFLQLMLDFKTQRICTDNFVTRVKELFKGRQELLKSFNTFLPKEYQILAVERKTVNIEDGLNFLIRVKNRCERMFESFSNILDRYRKKTVPIHQVHQEVAELFKDYQDFLKQFMRFLPDAPKNETPHHQRDNRRASGDEWGRTCDLHDDRNFRDDSPDLEHGRQRRCIEKDGRGDMDVRDYDRDKEDFKNREHVERQKERDSGSERDKERGRLNKGSSSVLKDAAFESNCHRPTPSYCFLPKNHPTDPVSGTEPDDASVLNIVLVSVAPGSEDNSFKHMHKNQYEESLFKCEDDRFELDMLLESVKSTAKRVKLLLKKIRDESVKPDQIQVEDHFSSSNLKCIEQIYGDCGLVVRDILHKNASLVLPVILTRLKQKQEEWSRCRSDFNKVWTEISAKNYHKSLDHRGISFKHQT